MTNGGKRPGAGRKPGYKAKKAEEANARYTQLVTTRWDDLVAAQLDLALGHYEKSEQKDGTEKVYLKSPDGKMLEYVTNRVVGKPKESVDVTSGGQTIAALVATLDD